MTVAREVFLRRGTWKSRPRVGERTGGTGLSFRRWSSQAVRSKESLSHERIGFFLEYTYSGAFAENMQIRFLLIDRETRRKFHLRGEKVDTIFRGLMMVLKYCRPQEEITIPSTPRPLNRCPPTRSVSAFRSPHTSLASTDVRVKLIPLLLLLLLLLLLRQATGVEPRFSLSTSAGLIVPPTPSPTRPHHLPT